jgi:hypothetical protein
MSDSLHESNEEEANRASPFLFAPFNVFNHLTLLTMTNPTRSDL